MKKMILLLITVLIINVSMAQEEYSLQEISTEASCVDYMIISSDGLAVDVISEVKSALQCPSIASIYGNLFIYQWDLEIKIYNIETQTTTTLFTVYDDIDGVSNPAWSTDGTKLAFVIINQEMFHDYEDICRIVVLSMKNGKVDEMQKFDRPVMFSCGSICTSIPGEDFYFSTDELLIYMDKYILTEKLETGKDSGNPTQKIYLNE
jgi:hypothetical protein